jgi:hypothetical protein
LLVKGENNWITILDYHTGDAWQIDGVNADYRHQTELCGTDACSLSTGPIAAAMTADTVAPDRIAIGGTAQRAADG